MSPTSNTTSTRSNFEALYDAALEKYIERTHKDLRNHPLASEITGCKNLESLLNIFQEQARGFHKFRTGDGGSKFLRSLRPVVTTLHTLSTSSVLSTCANFAFPPADAIFSAIGVLLSTVKSVSASYDALVEIFEHIENFLNRLMIYAEIPSAPAMTETIVKIMVEILSVLALATKQVSQGRIKKYAKKFFLGDDEIESALQRLNKLTQEELLVAVAQTRATIEDVKTLTNKNCLLTEELVKKMERDKLPEVCRWLSAPDPSINHSIAREACHPGTAAWLMQGDIFMQWKSTGSLLWIHGLPGSGKSILCSAIIEDVRDVCRTGSAIILYYYFDFRDTKKQDVHSLLSSLLIQLSSQSDEFFAILYDLYLDRNNRMERPTEDALMKCLKKMLTLPRGDALYVIIDALDECPDSRGLTPPRAKVLKVVEELVNLRLPHLHFCITSRPEIDIRGVLEPLANHSISLHDEVGHHQDITDYIKWVVPSHPKMRRWREEDRNRVIDALVQRANGMFRWVYCQLETLSRCFPQSIGRILEELPATLYQTYERALKAIDKEKWNYAHQLFQCLATYMRPLRVKELAEMFAIQPNGETIPGFDAALRPDDPEEFVLAACSTLVTIVDVYGDRYVQLSHFSVREYLTSDHISTSEHVSHFHILPKPAHTCIASACLSVLLHLGDHIDRTKIKNFPLAWYAAEYWVDHARVEGVSSDIKQGMECIFDRDKTHFAAWIWLHDMDCGSHKLTTCPGQPDGVPLYYAALCGFRDIAELLLNAHPQDINARGGRHLTPLHAALETGSPDTALLLLDRGADAGSRGSEDQTPLHIASEREYTEVLRWLIDHGSDLNAKSELGETPLYLASRKGRLEAARTLLEHGADADQPGFDHQTALFGAAEHEHEHVAQLLLDHRADPNAIDKHGFTPLHRAAQNGRDNIARLLLHQKANANVRDARGWTPLHLASFGGSIAVVGVLLEYGADVHARNGWERAPLHDASQGGHLDVVDHLLSRGADVNAPGWHRRTALHEAAGSGHLEVVQLLLALGGDPFACDQDGKMPLDEALVEGRQDVVLFLAGVVGGVMASENPKSF